MTTTTTRVFVTLDQKAKVAFNEKHFGFLPWKEVLLPTVSKLVMDGKVPAELCDGSCEGCRGEPRNHVTLTVAGLKLIADTNRENRPMDFDYVERKLAGIAGHIAGLREKNPSANLENARKLYESAAFRLGELKRSGAKDYRAVANLADGAVEEAYAAVNVALVLEAETLLVNASPSTKEAKMAEVGSAANSGGREGLRQLVHIVDGLKATSKTLAQWGHMRTTLSESEDREVPVRVPETKGRRSRR